ncbi:unnamed protein product [Medioppia subpectinata]|uniref:RING-type domain-containing protein n=1 Tax=Medioppia subpectinata TaxID=1979941 RepID=A0A7R9PYL4_9ACAR|nr:unnamed protein product [Medioppia subpectinata]CAG2106024.1 unnamed protein product [Medioppia subpectinata]
MLLFLIYHLPRQNKHVSYLPPLQSMLDQGYQMPGYSGDRFPELSAEDREDYSCSICQEIFNTPVTTTCCRQTFCEECINEWLNTNNTCPNDRKPLTRNDLSPAPRLVINLLGKLMIRCDYWDYGCHKVIKLDELVRHTIKCRYKVEKCVKCECEQRPGHDCIAALLAENRELKKMLAAEVIINKATKYMDKVNLDASGSKQIACVNGHHELKPGHDCIDELRAFKSQAQLEINRLKHELDAAKLALVLNTQALRQQQIISKHVNGNRAYTTDHQLLLECRRHVSAPVLLHSNMKADVTNKTLWIIRDSLIKQNSLYHVCKNVADAMDIEYGTSWLCIACPSDGRQAYCIANRRELMRVKIGPLTLLLFYTKMVNASNLRARIRRNKMDGIIKIVNSNMNPEMVLAVKAMAVEAIDRSDTFADIAIDIADQMDATYDSKSWDADRFPELSAEDRDEYTCSICQEIFKTPVTTTCCLQMFCEDCINEWLRHNTTCPYDRRQLTRSGLTKPPRLVMNTLNRFKIQCDHWAKGYNKPKCPKCQCNQTPGHDCIAALLHENSELKKKLADQLVMNEVSQNTSMLNIGAQEYRPSSHSGHTPALENISTLYAFKQNAQVEIDKLKQALHQANHAMRNNHALTNRSQFLNDRANITDHQLLLECRQHSRAPELLNDNMNPDMRDNTLAIIREQLVKQSTLYNVCKYVAKQMDLEYGVSWHCMTDRGDSGLPYYTYDRMDTSMTANMVESVKQITFEAIAQSDNRYTITQFIINNMNTRFPDMDWQCIITMIDGAYINGPPRLTRHVLTTAHIYGNTVFAANYKAKTADYLTTTLKPQLDQLVRFTPETIGKYPTIGQYLDRFEALPAINAYQYKLQLLAMLFNIVINIRITGHINALIVYRRYNALPIHT